MHPRIRSSFTLLFAGLLVALAAVAACGDDDGGGPPSGITPQSPVGEGRSPLEAVGSILTFDGLDGVYLDESITVPCDIEEVQDEPGVVDRIGVGQFCITFFNFSSTTGGTARVENRVDGGTWVFDVSIDGDPPIWTVEDIDKVSDSA
jgi:hypothetical protein